MSTSAKRATGATVRAKAKATAATRVGKKKPVRRAVLPAIPAGGGGRSPAASDPGVYVIDFPGRTAAAAAALGGPSRVAALLGVSRSQPTRWRQGAEQPSPEVARLLLDLEHVMARAQLVFTPKVARQWLEGSNSYLDGARPIDVLRTRGSSEVIDALDAAMQGVFS